MRNTRIASRAVVRRSRTGNCLNLHGRKLYRTVVQSAYYESLHFAIVHRFREQSRKRKNANHYLRDHRLVITSQATRYAGFIPTRVELYGRRGQRARQKSLNSARDEIGVFGWRTDPAHRSSTERQWREFPPGARESEDKESGNE